jgi:hypothetical protein
MWDWAKKTAAKTRVARNKLILSTGKSKETAWHNAAERGQVEILEKTWNWANELQLGTEELTMMCCCQKTIQSERPGTWQQKNATLK